MGQRSKNNVIHHINETKDKNALVTSIEAEKAFDKIQHPFMIKTQQSGHRRNLPQLVRAICDKLTAKFILSGEKLKAFHLRSGKNKTRTPTLTTVTQHSTRSPSHSMQTRKRNKRHPNQRGRNKTHYLQMT